MKQINLRSGAVFLLTVLASGSTFAASHFKVVFIDQYDQDLDGKVGSVEFEIARRARYDLTDEDQNSSVNIDEYLFEYENRLDEQLYLDRKEQVAQTATRFKSLDESEDGRITWEEYAASGNWSWKRFDSNEDTVIDIHDVDPMSAQITQSDDERSREQILHDTKRVLSMPSTHNKRGTLEQYDLNGDEAVTREEFDAGRKQNFDRIDTDANGWISENEYTYEFEDRLDRQIAITRKAELEQTIVRFNVLDRNEDKALRFAEYQLSGHRSFARYDTDGNGFVTYEEADPVEPEFSQDNAVEEDKQNS